MVGCDLVDSQEGSGEDGYEERRGLENVYVCACGGRVC